MTELEIRSYELLKRNVAECQMAGYFKGQDPEAVAFTLWATVHGIASLAIRRGCAMKTMITDDLNKMIEFSLNILRELIK